MTKFLSLLGWLTATSVFAQLTLKQDGSSESYIYVTDQVLYVADDISVTKDAGATNENAKSGIYLRDDAQLIQGASQSTSNQGTGFISVYQDSNSDSYDYNFWSAPIASADASNNFSLVSQVFNPGDSTLPLRVQRILDHGTVQEKAAFLIPTVRLWVSPQPGFISSTKHPIVGPTLETLALSLQATGLLWKEPMWPLVEPIMWTLIINITNSEDVPIVEISL